MTYLIKGLPNTIDVNGRKVAINTDFRTWIKYEEIMLKEDEKAQNQVLEAIDACLEENFMMSDLDELESLFDGFLWFYSLGKKTDGISKTKEEDKKESEFTNSSLVYSFEHDWAYIYSAFMECYNINLLTANLHWWEFKALFEGLNEKCLFSRIMSYRSIQITSKMSKDEKKFYRTMKKIYALPDERTVEEKENSFARSMMASMQI
ncbi:Gp15 family bacteriophage protein [uncultured Anaerococcus sp.]|uniref:Gp15 family bacteriophage protein n=1 Tax=uncultured Anaerococcus sp. TaxID=293428 RepID=UPI00288BE69B|nr:Gp15 family bacteriophage protein [uncultured Anaerococcus sp.]